MVVVWHLGWYSDDSAYADFLDCSIVNGLGVLIMRRKDREVTDYGQILEVLHSAHICHLGINDGGRVYVVPVNYGYDTDEGKIFLYIHGAKEGRKLTAIRNNHEIGFEMEVNTELSESNEACAYTMKYKSVIGEGIASELFDEEEKIKALNYIMEHETGRLQWKFPSQAVANTSVIKIEVTHISCKENR